jgi:aromatic amino acid aminotransferase I / 2-aminoadipate transaminase
MRANESSSQSASGFTQAFVAKLLVEEWGMSGWFRWLKGEFSASRSCCSSRAELILFALSRVLQPSPLLFPNAILSLSTLTGLKAEYRDRRNRLVDHLLDQGHAGLDSRSSRVGETQVHELRTKDSRKRDEKGYLAGDEMSEKTLSSLAKSRGGGQTMLSFVAPQGGMFGELSSSLSSFLSS